jgi:hypothetical protein
MKYVFLIILTLVGEPAMALELQGTATSLYSTTVIYIEKHNIENDERGFNKNISTEYSQPNGTVFAKMKTYFQKDQFLPDVEFEDQRFRLLETQTLDLSTGQIAVVKRKDEKIISEKKIKMINPLVAGQGFDNLIKANFNRLEANGLNINFLVLDKMDYLRFEVQQESKNTSQKTFSLSPESLFLRMFVKKIKVIYDLKSKALLRYQGISNIMDDQGKPQDVLISYIIIEKNKLQ